MNSLNHYALGTVGDYLSGMIGGIQADAPGYKRIRIRPMPGGGLTWARTSYDSIHGTIATAWKVEGDEFLIDVTIPPGTTATVYVPAKYAADIAESGRSLDRMEGVKFLCMKDGAAVFEVGAGHYEFKREAIR